MGCRRRPGREELAYLQYTSGSTRFPRGTMITQAAALHNLDAIFNHGFPLTPDDRFFSWLPYYHDMGLVGMVLGCVATQRSCDFLGSREFAMRPRLWLKLMSQNRSTISFSPPFGYALCARRLRAKRHRSARSFGLARRRRRRRDDPSRNGSMPLPKALAPTGFKASAFLPCYGMAECTLAVSFSPVGGGSQIDFVDGDHLAHTGEALPHCRMARARAARASSTVACRFRASMSKSATSMASCCRSAGWGASTCAARA